MASVSLTKSHGTIDVGSNADYTICGDDDLVLIGSNSVVSATGAALTLQAQGPGDTLTIGGDGQFAPDGADDIVLFQAPGTLFVAAFSRVDTNATQVAATLAGDDTFGIYGANDTIAANGLHDGLWIGQNGTAASGVDVVNGLTQGSLFELQDSNVSVTGSEIAATVTGDDVLSANGGGVVVSASGNDNVVNLNDGGVVNANGVAFLNVFGDHVIERGDGIFNSELIGAADRAVLSSHYDAFAVGGNGETGAIDVVVAAYSGMAPNIAVVADSNVRIVASNVQIVAHGQDRVVMLGSKNLVSDTAGGNLFVFDGQNNLSAADVGDFASVSAGDVVRLRADTQIGVIATGATSPSAAIVAMGADDVLTIGADLKVRVPVAVGVTQLKGFSATDTLVLAAHFADVADLLAHTSDGANGASIAFDAAGDRLQLDIGKAQVATFAAEGLIKFS